MWLSMSIMYARTRRRTHQAWPATVRQLAAAGIGAVATGSEDEDVGEPASNDPMRFHLRIEDRRSPKDVRFLTVLQGADDGASPDAATLLRSSSGSPYEGVVVAGRAVLFPASIERPATSTTVDIPAHGLEQILITGLEPRANYAVSR